MPDQKIAASAAKETVDPITFSVILSRFDAVVEEMTLALERSAWTSILALARDYSCGIYDAKARQVSMFDALPVHTTSLQFVVREIMDTFAGDIADGDVFICNDPYSKNTHIGDLVTMTPVIVDGEVVFWSVTKGHQMDTGAYLPSSIVPYARDVWQEGLTIPPLRLVEGGKMREDVLRLYLANMRYQDLVQGDLQAQLGSIEKGRRRLVELCREYSTDVVARYAEELIAYADRRMSREVESMPDGTYRAEAWVDSDGYERLHIPIKVEVTIAGDRVTVDFTGSGEQGAGGTNGTFATAVASGTVPFLYYISPDIPHNQGCIDHVEVVAPEGTICNARYPASTSNATVVPADAMSDAVNKAMVEAMPERVPAGGTHGANLPQFAGERESDGRAWGFMVFNNSGGQGAAHGCDGWPLFYNQAAMGGMKAQPIEQLELLYPVFIEEAEIAPDSMGFGRWIGGPGTVFSVRPLDGNMVSITQGDGSDNPPHGVLGGTAGIGGGQFVEDTETGARTFFSTGGSVPVRAGIDRYVGISTGGGGFGSPADRDEDLVLADVRNGIVSVAAAAQTFGVVVEDEGCTPAVARAATDAARERLRAERRPATTPTEPGAATWARDNMRDGDTFLRNPQL
jgi:N-methylhydantoinase B